MSRILVHARKACCALATALVAGAVHAEQPMTAADPSVPGEGQPLCCGVPPPDEVTADQVFGRWVVSKPGVGVPMRRGERIEFRNDGTVTTARGVCRFAVLRAELTVTCADKAQSGEIRFEDDTKLIWRHDGKEMIFVAPTD
jgi:hypothetical protein